MALPHHLYVITTQILGIPERFRSATAFTLIGIVLVMNVIATIFRSKTARKR